MSACEEGASDAGSVLKAIGENPALHAILTPSKRDLTVVDYCAYYLLSPFMVLNILFALNDLVAVHSVHRRF